MVPSNKPDGNVSDILLEHDALAISLANQLFSDVEAAYTERDFHGMWQLLFNFCRTDLQFYVEFCGAEEVAKGLVSAELAFSLIFTAVLQYLAPMTPFLAEEIFAQTNPSYTSIFQSKRSQLPKISQQFDTKVEWESLKKIYQSTN